MILEGDCSNECLESKLTEKGRELYEKESLVPVDVERDQNLRIKLLDPCGHACVFCHNEGTRVNNFQKRRVSIFLPKSGGFEAATIPADEEFQLNVESLVNKFGFTEVHFTGGEPTLHRNLSKAIELMRELGLDVKLTTNGETGGLRMKEYANAGLKGISLSIFGTTPEEYAETQPSDFGIEWAKNKLNLSNKTIILARENGVEVKGNCVMSTSKEDDRICRLIEKSKQENFDLRILNNLGSGNESIAAIYNLMGSLGAEPIKKRVTAGSSSVLSYLRLPDGKQVGLKQIRKVRFMDICSDCGIDQKGKCEEGFYGMRLYLDKDTNKYKVGLCIQTMDESTYVLDTFLKSSLPDNLIHFKEKQYSELLSLYSKK